MNKKFYILTISIFILFNPLTLKKSFAEDLMTQGLTGAYCSEVKNLMTQYPDDIKPFFEEGIRAFLTGANSALIIMDKSKEVRKINVHDTNYIIDYILKECAKDEAKGEDQQVWPILGIYFKELPIGGFY